MLEAELLSSLVASIYDAALDSTCWQEALRRTADFVGASAIGLTVKYAAGRSVRISHCYGADARWVNSYADEYVRYDPSTALQLLSPLERPITIGDIMPYPDYLDTKFHNEWAEPQGIVDIIHVVLRKSGTDLGILTLLRDDDDGMADETMIRRVSLVAPHIRRAAEIAGVVEARPVATAGLAEALDAIGSGVLLLGASGKIMHANVAASAMLAEGGVLSSTGKQLHLCDRNADRTLLAALGGGPVAPAVIPISAPGAELHLAHLVPLASDAAQGLAPAGAVAAVFVRRADLARITAPEALASAYHLTAGELRVLLAIVDIGGSPDVAEALGIAETTVKFHLRQIFDKTGTHRQADLVKLVAGFGNPLVA